MSCRWTAGIVADGTGPDAPGLDRDAERHLAGCRACRAAVARAERLDTALGMDLRDRRTDELPRAVLASPTLTRRSSGWRGSASVLAVGATLAVAAIASGIALNPAPMASPGPVGVTSEGPSGSVAASDPATPDTVALEPGRIVAVVNEPDTDVPLVVRTEPGTADPATITVERLHTGQRVRVLAGPVEADGYPWYEVSVGEVSGWVAAEAKDGSSPWLDTVTNGEILYTAPDDGGTFRLVSSDGGDARDLLDTPLAALQLVLTCGPIGSGSWTADGRYAVVTDGPTCVNTSIYRVDADGTGATWLGDGRAPNVTPSGDRVLFTPPACGTDCEGDTKGLMVAPADGSRPAEPMTAAAMGVVGTTGTWAPDGIQVAFSGYPADDPDAELALQDHVLYRYDGERVHRLTVGYAPRWSPDGRWIVFGRYDPASQSSDLFRIRPDGSGEEALGPGDAFSVRFSPDGTRIVFANVSESTNEVSVAQFDAPYRVVARFGPGAEPDWSPDGTAIVWVRFTDASIGDVTVAAADGGLPTVLTPGAAPAWRPLIGQAEAP